MAETDVFDGTFVAAVNSRGEKQYVPRHYLDDSTLAQGLRIAPSQADADRIAAGPSDSWTLAQLREHATTHGIDLGDATLKADVLDAVLHPTYSPAPAEPGDGVLDTTTNDTEAPATGDTEEE